MRVIGAASRQRAEGFLLVAYSLAAAGPRMPGGRETQRQLRCSNRPATTTAAQERERPGLRRVAPVEQFVTRWLMPI